MLLKQLYRTLLYFRPTLVLVIGAGLISVCFNITPIGVFGLTVFMTFLQPFIDKMRQVGQELEREARMNPPKPKAAGRTDRPRELQQSLARVQFTINWRLLLSYLLRPLALVSVLLVALFAAMYVYLYFRF